jgi:pyruvyltransferase
VKIYFWEGSRRHIKNFGDQINPMLLDFLEVQHEWAPPADAELVITGSLLEHLPANWSGTVCGAGKLHEHSNVDLSHAKVLALRGKLTADSVRGLTGPIVLGDPGLLVSDWIEQPVAKYDLGILPHWTDHQLAGRFFYGQLLSATDPPEQVIKNIARCKRVITSALHGLIVADAYGIPRQAELFPRADSEGGDFKYRDYCSVYDTHPHFGQMWRAPHNLVERVRGQLRGALAAVAGQPIPGPDMTPPCDVHPRTDGLPPRISLLVPYHQDAQDSEQRGRVWRWLFQFWRIHLPTAEIVIGYDQGAVFSKARAVKRAAQAASGEVFVVLDADTFIDPKVIETCAANISAAIGCGRRLWYVPYRRLYRLSEEFTVQLVEQDPDRPYAMPSPPPTEALDMTVPGNELVVNTGYLHGAMIQIMPAEAFYMCGGFDNRAVGWGGEDSAFLRAVDTIYCCHEVTNNDVCHLWHVRPGKDYRTRRWIGQRVPANTRLTQRYGLATGEAAFMRSLVKEHSVFGAGFSAEDLD